VYEFDHLLSPSPTIDLTGFFVATIPECATIETIALSTTATGFTEVLTNLDISCAAPCTQIVVDTSTVWEQIFWVKALRQIATG